MMPKKLSAAFILMLLMAFTLSACVPQTTVNPNTQVLYLKNNIHAQQGPREIKASYANWTEPGAGHLIIPVNTPVVILNWHRGFAFIAQDSGQKVYFELNRRNVLMDTQDYIELVTSPTQVPLSDFSEVDMKGIQEGRAYMGMTKEGVRIALGYPAPHQTPSLNDQVWTYWKNRWISTKVTFDTAGKVIRID